MLSELTNWWRIIRTAILATGVLLSFFVFVEILHIYSILRDVWPPFGYTFLFIIVAGLGGSLIYIFQIIKKTPKVLTPPNIEDFASISQIECRAYCDYLREYLKRLADNPSLSSEHGEIAINNIIELSKRIESEQKMSALLKSIDIVETECIKPLLSKLDQKAEIEVSKCVRDIMIGVTLSPYKAADLFIVIYRNSAMVLRIMKVYNTRPLLHEQILIFRDVLRVVATVNYMNFGQKLMDQFLSRVPYVGQVLDDCAQGIGAGLLTSAAGHGAIYRCRAYRGWNQEVAVQTMSSHVAGFMKDVKSIFKQDVWPQMRSRIYSTSPTEKTDDPGFWEKTTNGISAALDATESIVEIVIKKPVIAGTKGTIKAGSSAISGTRRIVVQGANGVWTATKFVTSHTARGIRFAGSRMLAGSKSAGSGIKGLIRKKRS